MSEYFPEGGWQKGTYQDKQSEWPLAIVAIAIVRFVVSDETIPANRKAVVID
jgi:hypothetical protein